MKCTWYLDSKLSITTLDSWPSDSSLSISNARPDDFFSSLRVLSTSLMYVVMSCIPSENLFVWRIRETVTFTMICVHKKEGGKMHGQWSSSNLGRS